jgi:hypothetical protein
MTKEFRILRGPGNTLASSGLILLVFDRGTQALVAFNDRTDPETVTDRAREMVEFFTPRDIDLYIVDYHGLSVRALVP